MDRSKVKEIIAKMTVEEKAAQLTQLNASVLMKTSAELTGADSRILSKPLRGVLWKIGKQSEKI